MSKVLCLFLTLALSTFSLASPKLQPLQINQDPAKNELTNQDVIETVKAGLPTDVIVAKIKSSASKFDTSPAVLTKLKTAGVSDQIILAMVKGPETTTPVTIAEVKVKIPDGTEIEIQLQNTLSGQEAKIGDIVDFTVVHPVVVNGVTVFEANAFARARVTTAKSSGHWGRAGKLEWAMQDVQSTDGNRVPARFTKRQIGDSKGGTVAVAAVATSVFLGPVGLLWGLKKGKAAIIPAGNRYTIFVHGDSTVKGRKATNAVNKK